MGVKTTITRAPAFGYSWAVTRSVELLPSLPYVTGAYGRPGGSWVVGAGSFRPNRAAPIFGPRTVAMSSHLNCTTISFVRFAAMHRDITFHLVTAEWSRTSSASSNGVRTKSAFCFGRGRVTGLRSSSMKWKTVRPPGPRSLSRPESSEKRSLTNRRRSNAPKNVGSAEGAVAAARPACRRVDSAYGASNAFTLSHYIRVLNKRIG
ncbi:hypothetical protein EVAR_64096_1 [Eumeta japonica]|uniref:Uncharacterized protein n=1 Tax=Eumeta variegata TaxID=151549 RepID=A0A4C1ZK17_EUMVA|nr:hypothetical protein EVAR_64096_1 [Eumeta japonica]